MLDLLYAGAARWRRRVVERHPERRRRLTRPVISIGNLSAGGTGKTPVVEALAHWLVAQGERPAILSRGYKRRDVMPGVVVVSDGRQVLSDIHRSGDEPLMLARAVPGARVCVAEDRYLAGVLAERQLDATVHLLDDGFQHFLLDRDLDVVVTTPGEISGGRVLPHGRLRESADAVTRADMLVVMGTDGAGAQAEAAALGVRDACGVARRIGPPELLSAATGEPPGRESRAASPNHVSPGLEPRVPGPVFLVAAIANPGRFADDVRAAGWTVAGEAWFADHHRFTATDVARIEERRLAAGAGLVFTTAKDAVRFEAAGARPFALFRVPLALEFDPPAALFDRVSAIVSERGSQDAAPTRAEVYGRSGPAGDPSATGGGEG